MKVQTTLPAGRPTIARARHAQRKTRDWWPAFRASLRPGLERDTQLMPWLIAESVCAEGSRYLGIELPARYAVWLEARAEVSYARFSHFRQLMRGRGNAPRGWLRAYMRHWLAGLLGEERPDLYECLPESFALGHPLPPGAHPRRRWQGSRRPLHPPRDWNPQLILQHRRWRWLAKRLSARTDAERTTVPNAVTASDQKINSLVYELYGLTPEEIALVELPPQSSPSPKVRRETRPEKQPDLL
jgi:lambda repressor-like predicted transcriptional regulator